MHPKYMAEFVDKRLSSGDFIMTWDSDKSRYMITPKTSTDDVKALQEYSGQSTSSCLMCFKDRRRQLLKGQLSWKLASVMNSENDDKLNELMRITKTLIQLV